MAVKMMTIATTAPTVPPMSASFEPVLNGQSTPCLGVKVRNKTYHMTQVNNTRADVTLDSKCPIICHISFTMQSKLLYSLLTSTRSAGCRALRRLAARAEMVITGETIKYYWQI